MGVPKKKQAPEADGHLLHNEEDKALIACYLHRIKEQVEKDPSSAKKAACIISEMLKDTGQKKG